MVYRPLVHFITDYKSGTFMELRELRRGDLSVLEGWFHDGETSKRLEGMLPLDLWFESVRKLPNQKNYMALIESISIGVVTLETYEDISASIALLVSPDYRNQGYGKAILRVA
jgi:GNAT superfamily N-acetyltransferase